MLIGRLSNSLVLFAVAAAIVAGSSAPLLASVILPTNLQPGSQYQIIFATSQETGASSGSVSTYNALAASSAALDSSLPAGVTWNAIVSTATVAAGANAPSFSNIPIFNSAGVEVSAGNLYSGGSLTGSVNLDENGSPPPISLIWTGATATGGISANPMGSAEPEFGESTFTTSSWITGFGGDGNGISWPVYALSSPITVAPEPGTLSLLAACLAGLGGVLLARRRAGMRA